MLGTLLLTSHFLGVELESTQIFRGHLSPFHKKYCYWLNRVNSWVCGPMLISKFHFGLFDLLPTLHVAICHLKCILSWILSEERKRRDQECGQMKSLVQDLESMLWSLIRSLFYFGCGRGIGFFTSSMWLVLWSMSYRCD